MHAKLLYLICLYSIYSHITWTQNISERSFNHVFFSLLGNSGSPASEPFGNHRRQPPCGHPRAPTLRKQHGALQLQDTRWITAPSLPRPSSRSCRSLLAMVAPSEHGTEKCLGVVGGCHQGLRRAELEKEAKAILGEGQHA